MSLTMTSNPFETKPNMDARTPDTRISSEFRVSPPIKEVEVNLNYLPQRRGEI